VPQVWTGSALEFLQVVKTAAVPTVHEAFTAQAQERRAEQDARPISKAASDFVDAVAGPVHKGAITLAQFEALVKTCQDHKVPLDKLEVYCQQHQKLEGPTLSSLKVSELDSLTLCVVNATKRRALLAHLVNYPIAS
jgi:hypothetical protein